ncbi:MAG: MMPL family transporter [Actinobacteria bacterium]|nr:MMPL family transporter [Actinomycetota bacterium]MCB9412131.1 MMPL family transporter [Actinomycetota bacterium]
MGAVSRWAVNKPWQAVIVWIVVLVGILTSAALFRGEFKDTFNLPDTESTIATNLLAEEFPDAAKQQASVVFSPDTGTVDQPEVQSRINELIASIEQIPSVESVESPFVPDAGPRGLVSEDQTVGRATVVFGGGATTPPMAEIMTLIDEVEATNTDGLQVGVAGQAVEFAGTEPPKSEILGIIVAIVIMLIMFAAVVAASMPILVALIGLGAGLGIVAVVARFTDIATFGPTLAAMIGLGVGIDYALFVINRYRQAVNVGREPREAALEAVNTAGRAVVFAGTAVVIALLGLFVLGISFMNGLAVGAAVTVIMVMLTAVTLLPAVISLLGRKTFAGRMPWAERSRRNEGRGLARYSRVLQRRPLIFGGIALIVMLALATPVLSMRLGFPDAGGKPEGNTSRIAYDLTTEGFGAGANGPFLIVAELPEAAQPCAPGAVPGQPESVIFDDPALVGVNELSATLAATPGVASASPVFGCTGAVSQDGSAAIISVLPTTGPQDEETAQLLATLRNDVIPPVAEANDLQAYVGGATAVTSDFSDVLAKALPTFLAVVVALGFLALTVLFRSLIVPLIGALTSLLSFGAALGAVVAVFQWGNFASLFGVTSTGPILPFLPVMLFAILFGLSMDYQVFLVSRMQEEWTRTGDNRLSVRRGLIGSGRVVMAAAAIMFSVFISFVFGDDNTIKMFGLALALAVLFDAFVVRLILVPALMTLLGKANWYLPEWLNRMLPKVHVETEEEAEEIVDPLSDEESGDEAAVKA